MMISKGHSNRRVFEEVMESNELIIGNKRYSGKTGVAIEGKKTRLNGHFEIDEME